MEIQSDAGNAPAAGNTEDNEVGLLRAVCDGKETAFEKLYSLYFERLYRFLYRFGVAGGVTSIEALINEIMYLVWMKAHTFTYTSRVSTWIFGIAVNVARKTQAVELRHRQRHVDAEEANFDAASNSWDEGLEAQDLLEKALAQLSPEHRAVVELTYYQGFHYREIADILNCPENTVKTRMYHAKLKLNDLLEKSDLESAIGEVSK